MIDNEREEKIVLNTIPDEVKTAIQVIREWLPNAKDTNIIGLWKSDARLLVWSLIQEGYCPHCGEYKGDKPCYCLRDD